jgi:sec-independent protein translocase protein TatC
MKKIQKYLPYVYELQQRVIRCALAFLVVLMPLLYYSREIYSATAQPLLKSLPMGSLLIATEVITPFTIPIKLAFFVALMLLIPYILFHCWAYVKPALYPKEKRAIFPILLMSTSLFYAGCAFAHFLVCPLALHFFAHAAPKGVTVMTDMTHYLDFILVLYFAFGIAFQVPIITFLLIRFNIISIATLEKNRPIIIVSAFVVGMLLTPPDVISQILLALPLLGLFESGLLLAKWLLPAQVLVPAKHDP